MVASVVTLYGGMIYVQEPPIEFISIIFFVIIVF